MKTKINSWYILQRNILISAMGFGQVNDMQKLNVFSENSAVTELNLKTCILSGGYTVN